MNDAAKGKDPKTAILIRQLMVIAALLALFASILPWAFGLGEKNRVEMNSFQSGQVVVIKKAIVAAASEEDYYRIFALSAGEDTQTLIQMVKEGRAFSIPMGSKVRVEKKHLGNCEITVLDGSMGGKFGWVPIGIMR